MIILVTFVNDLIYCFVICIYVRAFIVGLPEHVLYGSLLLRFVTSSFSWVPISFPKPCARACMGSCPGPFVKTRKTKKDDANTTWP